MKNLISLIWCLLAFIGAPALADAENKVLIVKSMSVPIIESHVQSFQKHLESKAKQQGVSYRTVIINAEGNRDWLHAEMGEVIGSSDTPSLIVSSATLATQEVFNWLQQHPETAVPQVYFTVTDPWGAGVVDGKSLVSGVPYYLPSDIKVKLAKRLVAHKPDTFNIGFVHSSYPSDLSDFKRVEAAAKDAGIGFHSIGVDYRPVGDHLESMLLDIKAKARELDAQVDYWWLAKGPLGERPETVSALAEVSNKPVLYGNSLAAVKQGAIFFAAVSNDESMRIAADLAVDRLLDRPFDPSSQAVMGQAYELFFNIQAAAKAEIIVPSDLLEIATKNSGVVGDQ